MRAVARGRPPQGLHGAVAARRRFGVPLDICRATPRPRDARVDAVEGHLERVRENAHVPGQSLEHSHARVAWLAVARRQVPPEMDGYASVPVPGTRQVALGDKLGRVPDNRRARLGRAGGARERQIEIHAVRVRLLVVRRSRARSRVHPREVPRLQPDERLLGVLRRRALGERGAFARRAGDVRRRRRRERRVRLRVHAAEPRGDAGARDAAFAFSVEPE